jgi:hypothetical protein
VNDLDVAGRNIDIATEQVIGDMSRTGGSESGCD